MLRVVLAVALLAAPAASAGAPSSPCKLATTAQVKAAFGGTVGAGKVDNSLPGEPVCKFSVKGSNLGFNGDAVVFVTPGQTMQTFKLAEKSIPGVVAVAGIGSGAFYNPHSTSIELIKGGVVASAQGIFLNPGGPQPNAAKVKADVTVLAKAVAGHV